VWVLQFEYLEKQVLVAKKMLMYFKLEQENYFKNIMYCFPVHIFH